MIDEALTKTKKKWKKVFPENQHNAHTGFEAGMCMHCS